MVGQANAVDRNVFLLLHMGWSWKFPWATTSVTPGFSHRRQREIGPKKHPTCSCLPVAYYYSICDNLKS